MWEEVEIGSLGLKASDARIRKAVVSGLNYRPHQSGRWLPILFVLRAEKQAQAVHHDYNGAAFMTDDDQCQRDSAKQRESHQHTHRSKRDNEVLTNNPTSPLAEPKGSKE